MFSARSSEISSRAGTDIASASPGKFIFGAESKANSLHAVSPTVNNPRSLHTGVHQIAPNLRRTFSYHPDTSNVGTELPGTVVSTGPVNRLSIPPRLGSMTDMPAQVNPNSLVATDPKVIRATMANGLIATQGNQDNHYGLIGAASNHLVATLELCQGQRSSIGIVPMPR